MDQSVNYMIYSEDEFQVDEKLTEFNKTGGYNLVDIINDIEDIFIKCEESKVDCLFVILIDKKTDSEILENTFKVLKTSFPGMCICLFSATKKKFLSVDFQYNRKQEKLHIYNVLLKIKHPFSNTSESYFIAPKKISELLNHLKIQKKYKGYTYLKDAIDLLCRNSKEYIGNMSKLYKVIAKKYEVSDGSIERCIRLVLTEASLYVDYKKIENSKYKSIVDSLEKSSNAEFLRAVSMFLIEDLYA